ncbi:MAG TPA: excisionase family DNA-binding protein, partial [Gemmatimonadaceae bacterium]|nr:excisionase family DNA-binding protein [Gemmatimonadaceae bacterium]
MTLASKQDIAQLRSYIDEVLARLRVELATIICPNKRYMDVKECAEYVGRTNRAIEGLVRRRQIPHIRVGRRVQFDREKIDRWVAWHSKRGAR